MNKSKKKECGRNGWRVRGERDRGSVLTQRRTEMSKGEGGLLKPGRSKAYNREGQYNEGF